MRVASSISDGIFLFCFSKLKTSFDCWKPELEEIYLLCNKAEKPPGFSPTFFSMKNTTSPIIFFFNKKVQLLPDIYFNEISPDILFCSKTNYNFSSIFSFLRKKIQPRDFFLQWVDKYLPSMSFENFTNLNIKSTKSRPFCIITV